MPGTPVLPMQHAELISTGSELLSGKTINSHAATLATALRQIGIQLTRDTTLPDDTGVITEAIRSAAQRVPLVIVSGGLGPTEDDLTRCIMQRILDRPLHHDPDALERIRLTCEKSGRDFNEARRQQALVFEQAVVLPNSVGAAPGQWIEQGGATYVLLPGPPPEFKAVLDHALIPLLRQRMEPSALPPEKLFLINMAEADLVEAMRHAPFDFACLQPAYCTSERGVELRLLHSDHATLEAAAHALRQTLGTRIYAEDRTDLAEVIGTLLRAQRATLATAESCTGGLIGHRITQNPGASQYYLGGIIAYANDVKTAWLGITEQMLDQYGAVSEPVARHMAEAVRTRLHATYGLGITGVAGPHGGTTEKPVGLIHMAIAGPDDTRHHCHHLPFDRTGNKERAAQTILDHLRLRLLESAQGAPRLTQPCHEATHAPFE